MNSKVAIVVGRKFLINILDPPFMEVRPAGVIWSFIDANGRQAVSLKLLLVK